MKSHPCRLAQPHRGEARRCAADARRGVCDNRKHAWCVVCVNVTAEGRFVFRYVLVFVPPRRRLAGLAYPRALRMARLAAQMGMPKPVTTRVTMAVPNFSLRLVICVAQQAQSASEP